MVMASQIFATFAPLVRIYAGPSILYTDKFDRDVIPKDRQVVLEEFGWVWVNGCYALKVEEPE